MNKAKCPNCSRELDSHIYVDGDDSVKPVDGDFSMCTYCGELSVFSHDGTLRKLNDSDLEDLPDGFLVNIQKTKEIVTEFNMDSDSTSRHGS